MYIPMLILTGLSGGRYDSYPLYNIDKARKESGPFYTFPGEDLYRGPAVCSENISAYICDTMRMTPTL